MRHQLPRPSAFYDQHFSSNLVRASSIPSPGSHKQCRYTALQDALNTLPPLNDFITAQQRARDPRNLDTNVTDKKEGADIYNQTTARYCPPLVSTLALHPTASFSQWLSLSVWTPPSGYPIMDGLLRFIGEGVGETKALRAAIVEGMESENRRIFGR